MYQLSYLVKGRSLYSQVANGCKCPNRQRNAPRTNLRFCLAGADLGRAQHEVDINKPQNVEVFRLLDG